MWIVQSSTRLTRTKKTITIRSSASWADMHSPPPCQNMRIETIRARSLCVFMVRWAYLQEAGGLCKSKLAVTVACVQCPNRHHRQGEESCKRVQQEDGEQCHLDPLVRNTHPTMPIWAQTIEAKPWLQYRMSKHSYFVCWIMDYGGLFEDIPPAHNMIHAPKEKKTWDWRASKSPISAIDGPMPMSVTAAETRGRVCANATAARASMYRCTASYLTSVQPQGL